MNPIGLRSYQDIPSKYWLPHDDYDGVEEVGDDSVQEIEREPEEDDAS